MSEEHLTQQEVDHRRSHFGHWNSSESFTNLSHSSFAAHGAEVDSTVSRSSAAGAVAAAEQNESPVDPSQNRPSNNGRMSSLAETLASPTEMTAAQGQIPEQGVASRLSRHDRRQSDQISETPVSPPTSPPLSNDFAHDYLTAREVIISPVMRARQSAFRESEEDIGKK